MRRDPAPRRHLGGPLLLLLASLGLAAVAAVQGQRAAVSHQRTARQLLHDFSTVAAWSYSRHSYDALELVLRHVLEPILHHEPHELPRWPDAANLPGYRDSALAWCRCEPSARPATYLAWFVGAPEPGVGRGSAGITGAAMDPPMQRAVLDTINRHVRDPRQPRHRAGLVALRHGERVTLLAYGLMPMLRGDTIVYAFTFEPTSLGAALREAAEHPDLLPAAATHGRAAAELVAARVLTPRGDVLWESPRYPDWPYESTDTLALPAGGLRVQASVRPEAASALVAGGLPQSRTGLLLALVGLAAALAALAALAVRQLRREQELARLRADFVAGVSHELRTPLAQIRLFLETLRLGRWRTEQERLWLLGHVDRETTRLSHLVENVLAFARLGRGVRPEPLPAEVCDVGAEAAEAVRMHEPLAAQRRARLALHADADALAPLDAAAFRQLLLNLLDNAVKYGPAGQTITVRVARRGALVSVTVEDGGPGVPAEERARVWEPFFRGTAASASTGGSGIGLAIVHEIARRHGGRARVEAAASGGACVVVELPAALPLPAPGTSGRRPVEVA
ncbi:MAG TPA: HAMP domain-containing sensor histidine kinase [Gemmatimonadaceae bacterium]|nr:HAMP domain-containing sensor histidine kinase [Gemmatimonadaceae bacterium]